MLPTSAPTAAIFRRSDAPTDVDSTGTVVWLHGEHDLASVGALSGTLAEAVDLDDADVVVDLSGVEFMDASILGALVSARLTLRARSRSLTLRAPSAAAERVLVICGLADPGCPTPGGIATG